MKGRPLLHLDLLVRVVSSSGLSSSRRLHSLLRDDRERSAVPHLAEPGRVAPLVQRQADRVELRDRAVKAGLSREMQFIVSMAAKKKAFARGGQKKKSAP